MFELFANHRTTSIVLSSHADECVRLAAHDLRENLLSLSGKTDGFSIVTKTLDHAITVQTAPAAIPRHREGYTVKVTESGVIITGCDALGTVYGIYAFATNCLGIDPLYRFTDIFPETRECMELPDTYLVSKENPTRFRGWFINDEDFLSGYAPSGSKRRITYNSHFFKEVLSVEMMDVIYESALRLGMNMIIPCSFIDMLNPAEEAIVERAVKRGLYVSQHHQEPVGVAYFAAENYMLAHYPEKAVSYVASPTEMEEIWRVYIEKWARYEPQVIWQLGLRGKGDKAVWHTDSSVASSAAKRGAIISSAIATQYRLIAETVGHTDFLSTSTLWLEGAALYDAGHLKMPPNTITVFSDIGDTQLFGGDFYSVARRPDCQYGIYYHAGFFVEGPHYCDGTDPQKMVFCYREAEQYRSLSFSVLNVANIREMCSSIRLNAAILEGSPREFDLARYYAEIYPALYGDGGKETAELEQRYFAAIGDMGDRLGGAIVARTDFHYHSIPDLPFPYYPLTDGALCRMTAGLLGAWRREIGTWKEYTENEIGRLRLYEEAKGSAAKLSALLTDIDRTEKKIARTALSHYRFAIRYKVELMRRLYQWAACACEMYIGRSVEENRRIAILRLTEILQLREEFNRGKWKGWYDCDKRLNLQKRIEETLAFQYTENKEN